MDIFLYFIGPVIGVLVVTIVMSKVYKDTEKKDKGFVMNYYKLSYRRRFIRALWGIPMIFIVYIIMYRFSDLTANEYIIIGVIFLLLISWDIVSTYTKWKKNEEEA